MEMYKKEMEGYKKSVAAMDDGEKQ